jgi:uncharacterized protein YjbJ (UPF0337 family)
MIGGKSKKTSDAQRPTSNVEAKRDSICPISREVITTVHTSSRMRLLFEMRSSTKDRVKGRVQEAKGKLKEKAGRAARDPNLQDRGTAERVGGKVQRKVGEVKKVFGA